MAKKVKQKKAAKFIVTRTFEKYLAVELTQTELVERAKTMAVRSKDLDDLEAEKATVMRDYGEKLKNLYGEISRYAEIVRKGEEDREVKCQDRVNVKERTMETVRLDDNEVIYTRGLTQSEKTEFLQEKLFPAILEAQAAATADRPDARTGEAAEPEEGKTAAPLAPLAGHSKHGKATEQWGGKSEGEAESED